MGIQRSLGGGVRAGAGESFARLVLVETVSADAFGIQLEFAAPITWTLVGLGYLAIAEIINRGRAMRVELDEVI